MSWVTDSLREFFRKGDLLLLGLCTGASLFGLVLVFSATRYLGASGSRQVVVQFAAICLGIIVYFLFSSVDIELLTERSWKLLLIFTFLIILALLPFGVGDKTTGNKSWIPLPLLPINVQPAEVAKLTFILLLAWMCSRFQEKGISRAISVFQLAGFTLVISGLIAVISGDFGMVLTYLFLFVVISWAAGVKKRWFLLALVLGAVALVIVWPHMPSYIKIRFTVVIDHLTGNLDTIKEQTQGLGWQQTRSIMAIGSGGLFGQGYMKGIQTQSPSEYSLNARYTDEIFAVCGEEFGLVGCVLLLLLLSAIILRCIWVARRACSPQSALIAMGYAGMLLIQVAINVSMCLYLFPVVGLTLPFISYGGSSILTMFAAMGIISGIKMRSLPSWLRDRNRLQT